MFRRLVKIGLIGGVAGGTFASLNNNDFQIDSIGLVRLGRTALAAYSIGRTYKTKLFYKEHDKSSDEYKQLKSKTHYVAAQILLDLCRTNKGVYIKVGQHIGALDYMLPNEYVNTMKVLHKDAPCNSLEMIYKVIKEDTKQSATDLFDDFDATPLGTASLAQVHKARLKDGTPVAVKVQHYYVRGNVRTDLRVMEAAVRIMSWFFPDFQMQWLVNETKRNIYRELDFEEEGRNAEKMAAMFVDYKWLKVPKIFWEHTTKRVLVMEFVNGGQVNDFKYIKKQKINPYDLSKKLGDLYAHMIFERGFVHSDPHPGNILVKKDDNDKDVTVYLLDHGLYATLTDEFRYDYSQLWLSIINRDKKGIRRQAERLGIEGDLYGLFACMVSGRPWDSILKGINNTQPDDSEKKQFQTELPNMLSNITMCLENMDRQLLLLLKTNDLIRSIESSLGTQKMMCGFKVMAKCCLVSVNNEKTRKATTFYQRFTARLERFYINFLYNIHDFFSSIRYRFLL